MASPGLFTSFPLMRGTRREELLALKFIHGRALRPSLMPYHRRTVKIRILEAMAGVMDGHSLTQFLPGFIYDVDETLGAQLVAMKIATEVRFTDSPTNPGEETDMDRLTGGVQVVPRDKVDETREPRRRKRR